jgi:hypothetical protein
MIKNYTHSNSMRIALLSLSVIVFAALLNTAKAQTSTLPKPDHIIVIIEENQANSLVIGSSVASIAPYINSFVGDTDVAVFTKLYAIEHPSQPNYLDFFAGGNQGVLDDNLPANYPFTTPNLAWELLNRGYTFATYSQDLPSVGSDVQNSSAPGTSYARKHNPVTNWVGTGQFQVPDTLNQPFTSLPMDFSQLPTVSFIVPDEDSDMHNGSYPSMVTVGDYWMQTYCSNLIEWARTHNSLVIYTFDEDDGFENNNIPTLFIGPMVKPGSYSQPDSLYNILRTVEDMYSLGQHAGAAAQATDITNIWKSAPSGIAAINANSGELKVSPNPASALLTIDATKLADVSGDITITDVTGRSISQYMMPESKILEVNTTGYTPGLYFYHLAQSNGTAQTGKFVVSHQ